MDDNKGIPYGIIDYNFNEKNTPKKPIQTMMTWQCPSCYEEIRDNWKYCPYCGQLIKKEN